MIDTGDTIGSYRIVRPLGKGGMGEVYEVEHVRLGTHYALKAFALDHGDVNLLRERFVAEGKVLARLSHPNLVRVFELDHDAATGTLYFVMDLVRGARSFADLEEAPAEEADLARWFAQLAAALDYIHDEGIVHRDVKPSNILVDEKGDVRLVDFGVSRYTGESVRREIFRDRVQPGGAWQSGTLNVRMGTGAFMAPEVTAGLPATAASDAYSLGLVFFHLLTGVWYAPGRNMLRLLEPLEYDWRAALEPLLRRDPSERSVMLRGLAKTLDTTAESVAESAIENKLPAKRIWHFVSVILFALGAILCAVWFDWFSASRYNSDCTAGGQSANTNNLPYIVATNYFDTAYIAEVSNVVTVANSQLMATNIQERDETVEPDPPVDDNPIFGHDIPLEFDDGVSMPLVWCAPGEFDMGSPEDESGRFDNEMQRRVKLTKGFWIAKYETTQGQWSKLFPNMTVVDLAREALLSPEPDDLGSGNAESAQKAGERGWRISKGIDPATRCGDKDDRLPVYYVSWAQATNFCARLMALVRRENDFLPDGYEFRLPTEAEWEYACRAGSKTGLPDNRKMLIRAQMQYQNICAALDDYAWFGGNSCNDFRGRGFDVTGWTDRMYEGKLAAPHRVGTRTPNDWGICDMLGNVWEWCVDWYGPYDKRQWSDPMGPDHGQYRVTRGGSWNTTARQTRAAFRTGLPDGLGNFIGFRVVLGPKLNAKRLMQRGD